ncbi:unnamed protein product [Trichobilharzia szidati]|nr:unnamed protein product [Trichobilharzia szidati]
MISVQTTLIHYSFSKLCSNDLLDIFEKVINQALDLLFRSKFLWDKHLFVLVDLNLCATNLFLETDKPNPLRERLNELVCKNFPKIYLA